MSIVAYVLGALGVLLTLSNYWLLLKNYLNRRRGIERQQSMITLVGGVLMAVGAYHLFGTPLALLVVLLDPGTSVILLMPVALLRDRSRKP